MINFDWLEFFFATNKRKYGKPCENARFFVKNTLLLQEKSHLATIVENSLTLSAKTL